MKTASQKINSLIDKIDAEIREAEIEADSVEVARAGMRSEILDMVSDLRIRRQGMIEAFYAIME